jgi:hypothetical protein
MRSSRPPVAIFFVRVWYEDGQFRARTRRSRADEPLRDELTADPETVVAQLRLWLQELDAEWGGEGGQ